MTTSVVLIGLGATGRAIASSLRRREDIEIVGAVDSNPATAGKDLGAVLAEPDHGVTVVASPSDLPVADLAVIATTSDLRQVAGTVLPLLELGYNVLSICEELGYPWRSHPGIARRLDETAKAHGVTVAGGGANPGVLMDTLPLLLSTLTQRARTVRIRRRTDMSPYSGILPKFGLGSTVADFDDARRRGDVVGHHGFAESIEALATGLGWRLDTIEVGEPTPCKVRTSGQICAINHGARGLIDGEAVIDLEIMFALFDPSDDVSAGDEYQIIGDDQTIDLRSGIGFDSFRSTIAAAVNSATAVVGAPPGLLSMGDLSARAIASKGRRTRPATIH